MVVEALHTHLRPSVSIFSRPYSSLAIYTLVQSNWIICTVCGGLKAELYSLAFYTYRRPYIPVLHPLVAGGMVLSAYKRVESAN